MKTDLQTLIFHAVQPLLPPESVLTPDQIQIERTKNRDHGDFACNIAMVLAKSLKQNPRHVATQICEKLNTNIINNKKIAKIEIAGAGFINIFLKQDAQTQVLADIFAQKTDFGKSDFGKQAKIVLEYVSANPTGPLHVGHGRGAAYGSAVANILMHVGYDVTREFYINDAGRQVDVLAVSVWLRALALADKTTIFPRGGYQGDYIFDLARDLLDQNILNTNYLEKFNNNIFENLPNDAQSLPETASEAEQAAQKTIRDEYLDALIRLARQTLGEHYEILQTRAVKAMLARIKATLTHMHVEFDVWSSEKALVTPATLAQTLEKLASQNATYRDAEKNHLWLKTAERGDTKDRVLVRGNGVPTYFANDAAYHLSKVERQFARQINVWGADHHGYIKRVQVAVEALSGKIDTPEVKLVQFVTLASGRMGKRSGNYVTLQQLLEDVGVDATRFFFLMRAADQHIEFDLELAKRQSMDNPVYYLQYSHARVCSVFVKLSDKNINFNSNMGLENAHLLTNNHEYELLNLLSRYPETLLKSAEHLAPQNLVSYLRELAENFHSFYGAHKILIEDQPELTQARLLLVDGVRQVMANGLGLLGLSAPEKM